MKVTFLGTGNARGLPVYGSTSDVASRVREQPELFRTQSAVLLETEQGELLLDAGRPDLCNLINHSKLQAICVSHFHSDHVLGLIPIKWGTGAPVTVFHPEVETGYADLFSEPGLLQFKPALPFSTYTAGEFKITPLPLIHGIQTQGYAIECGDVKVAYLCDTCGLPQESIDFLEWFQPDLSIIDCNQAPGEGAGSPHNDLGLVMEIKRRASLSTVYITHIGEGMQRWLLSETNQLPLDVYEARDGTCLYM